MASKTDIANLALSHLGHGQDVSDLDLDTSAEARACRAFYDLCLEATLSDFSWPFATKITDLALIGEDPNDEWGYSYRYPLDCLRIRRLLSGINPDTRQSRVPFQLIADDSSGLIYTDEENAQAEYTVLVTNVTFMPSDFKLALSYRLAHYIAPRVSAGDPFKVGQMALSKYVMEIEKARANAANEEQAKELPESEFVRVRD